MHHWILFHKLSSRPHAKDKHEWAASILCRKFMVTCEASGAREHGHDSKHEASSGRTNNARKGVDESVWAVQLVEHAGKEVMEEKKSCWKKTEPGESSWPPRPVGLGRPASPTKGAPRLLSSAGKLPSQFVCSSFRAQNHRRHSQPSQA
jgi:hypothetical protein